MSGPHSVCSVQILSLSLSCPLSFWSVVSLMSSCQVPHPCDWVTLPRVWSVSCVPSLQANLLDICTVAWLFDLVVTGYCWTNRFWFSHNLITQQLVCDNPVALTKNAHATGMNQCVAYRASCSNMKNVTVSSLLPYFLDYKCTFFIVCQGVWLVLPSHL